MIAQFQLPDGVKCIVADDDWLYAGCDDGNVYDLSGKVPRLSYEIAHDVDIYWLDISGGVLGVSDADGGIAVFNHEDESQWRRPGSGTSGWMVRCDDVGVYHGHSNGVHDVRLGETVARSGTATPRAGCSSAGRNATPSTPATSGNVVHAFGKDGEVRDRVPLRRGGVLLRRGARRQVRLRRGQPLLGVLLRRGRYPAVEARHRAAARRTRCSTPTSGSTS